MSEAIVVGSGPNGLACAAALAAPRRSRHGDRGRGDDRRRHAERRADRARGDPRRLLGRPRDGGRARRRCSSTTSPATGSSGAGPRSTSRTRSTTAARAVMLRSIEDTAAGLGADGGRWKADLRPPRRRLRRDLARTSCGRWLRVPAIRCGCCGSGFRRRRPPPRSPAAFAASRRRALFGGVAAHAFRPFSAPMSSSVGMALIALLPPLRLAGRARRLAGDRRRARRGRPRARRDDRDRPPGRVARRAAGGRRGDPRSRARRRRRARRRPAARARRARLPPLPPRPGGVQGRPRGRGRRPVDGGERPPGGDRARDRLVRGDGGRRARGRRAGGCRSVRSSSSASSTSPTRPARAATSIRCGRTRTSRTAGKATRPRPSSARSSASPRGCASGSSPPSTRSPAEIEAANANYVGGDIITGANTLKQILFRPRFAADPYATGIPGVYICSAATPPGAGAHGMNGYNAARSALRAIERAA